MKKKVNERSFFHLVCEGGQYRVDFVTPLELEGFLRLIFFMKGPLLDGTKGRARKIWARLGSAGFGKGSSCVTPSQVHGTALLESRPIWGLPNHPQADAVLLLPGSPPSFLRFADCCPVAVAGRTPFPWLVLIHSGYQGTLKGIVPSVLEKLSRRFGGECLRSAWCWLGPCIGPCCYSRQKSDPTTIKGLRLFPRSCREDGGLVYFDLHSAIRHQLEGLGIPSERIAAFSWCTACNPLTCYSYRGGEREDRMVLWGELLPLMPQKGSFW